MLVKAFLKDHQLRNRRGRRNGALAVNKFTSGQYDVVLMDMYMPVVDGYAFPTAAIRKWSARATSDASRRRADRGRDGW